MSGREVATRYAAIAGGMTHRIAGCRDWSAPTPCPGWTTLDVVVHVIAVHRSALSLLDDEQAPPSPDDAADVVVAAWHAATASWDLARSTRQDEGLDRHAVEFAWTWMQVAGDNLRASGSFGPAVPPPDDADPQTRLLCFLGRDVRGGAPSTGG
jgi:hypothetical protein